MFKLDDLFRAAEIHF